jgi:hypothetical protein
MAITANHKVASLNEILATRSRAIFPHRVNFEQVGYETLKSMISWCEKSCKGIWRCEKVHAIYFQFSDDYDATMFMLKWGGAKGNILK